MATCAPPSWCWLASGLPAKAALYPLSLPAIETPADVVSALGMVANAVGAGELTPEEGASVAAVLEIKRRAIETSDLEVRIVALEKEQAK
jgi:hypothetical protein